jgi:membrane protein
MANDYVDSATVRHAAARDWRGLFKAVRQQIERDRLSIVAAGVAFYALMAVFPALAALVAIYGLLLDPQQVSQQIAALGGLLPQQALDILLARLNALLQAQRSSLGWGAVGGLLLALWSASKGIRTLMEALNMAYDERETRGFVRRTALVLGLTLAAIVGTAVAIAAIVIIPAVIQFIGLGPLLEGLLRWLRWPVVAAVVAFGIAVMYRYATSRPRPGWPLVAWGAVIATVLWLVGSGLFSLYVSSFGNFDKTYGSIAAIVVLLMWFLMSSYAVLIGAEINAELERRVGTAG